MVSTNSECAPLNEWMNPPSGIAVHRSRLNGRADLQRQFVESRLPVGRLEAPFVRQPPERPYVLTLLKP